MTTAFSCLNDVLDLGLCMDSGLGWLNGPDESDRCRLFKTSPAIFPSRFATGNTRHSCQVTKYVLKSMPDKERSPETIFYQYARLLIPYLSGTRNTLRRLKEYMHANPIGSLAGRLAGRNAGVLNDYVDLFLLASKLRETSPEDDRPEIKSNDDDLDETVRNLVLSRAKVPVEKGITLRERRMFEDGLWGTAMSLFGDLKLCWCGCRSRVYHRQQPEEKCAPPIVFDGVNVMDQHAHNTATRSISSRLLGSPLVPSRLTNQQLRIIKEHGWAQHSFLNTFILSVVDNRVAMSTITSLTIANVGSSCLYLLNRKDLWEGLPNVNKVTLFVSPDWREISSAPSFDLDVDEHRSRKIYPSQALEAFKTLLDGRIRTNPKVRYLTLGFIGGGEHALGMFARNRHILPAPIVDSVSGEVNCFPYVERLTLVNCWAVPRVLTKFVKKMRKMSLTKLKLESFSLVAFGGQTMTGTLGSVSMYLSYHFNSENVQKLGFGVPHPTINSITNFENQDPSVYELVTRHVTEETVLMEGPLADTWGQVLNSITPRDNTAEAYHNHGAGLGSDLPPPRDLGSLNEIELLSCGYVQLPFQELIEPFQVYVSPPDGPLRDRRNALLRAGMMDSKDFHLGQIIPRFIESDRTLMTSFFRMRVGWGEDDLSRFHNLEDGQLEGGTGRFSGVIRR